MLEIRKSHKYKHGVSVVEFTISDKYFTLICWAAEATETSRWFGVPIPLPSQRMWAIADGWDIDPHPERIERWTLGPQEFPISIGILQGWRPGLIAGDWQTLIDTVQNLNRGYKKRG